MFVYQFYSRVFIVVHVALIFKWIDVVVYEYKLLHSCFINVVDAFSFIGIK